jgi:hypothetical protein
MVRASKKAGTAAEGLRTSYAEHQRVVAALPAQRAAKAARKGKGGMEIDKGLNKAAPAAAPVQAPRPAGQIPPGGLLAQAPAKSADPVRGIGDLWQRKGA